ncbi:2,3-bisphosphoglycerate-dependent phosphoglycerate mutase [Actinomycetospora endophytica]|uniref:phosphoglycerate mutase (2,3-diphosphoglycerate-dependent) n=2 Tax=Actinomycetospora endophytica TaxID=2291215 RepID=A0ABS8PIW6_9PSEU|nr:2,3-bisphosphoglycerate-dependent phosphoglycerate mutase [Actinomycetospora endophytica]
MGDPELTHAGRDAARRAGAMLRRANLRPDQIWASTLTRARDTAALAAIAGDFADCPATVDHRLDERHYGDYTGRRKAELVDELGYEQYLRLRRDVDLRPPPMTAAQRQRHRTFPAAPEYLAGAESLADVTLRAAAFHRERILPALALSSRTVLVVAHGDSLRALCAVLDDLSSAELRELTIPAATPLVYRFDWLLRTETRGGRYLSTLGSGEPLAPIPGQHGEPR